MGTDIIRFDLYGSDVLIANKMESNGGHDRIHISEQTKKLIELVNTDKKYIFTPAENPVYIKALNKEVPSYWVDRNVQDS